MSVVFFLLLQIDNADSVSEGVHNEFAGKKRCLVEQYNQYREPELSENLDGERTFRENLADNTGLMLAYRAYTKWNEKSIGSRQSLIGLDYTWNQLFWLSAAQTWCGVYRKGIKFYNGFWPKLPPLKAQFIICW